MNTCDCPKCHNGDIETDDCFDISHSNGEIIEYYVGHCLACGQSYQWEKHYKFAFQTDFEED
jgi:hypothetical protein